MIEYRIGWSASSNISFDGHDDWQPWDDEDASAEDVESYLNEPERRDQHINLPPGLEMALEASGFDWYVETREAENG
jgi:hypothetical protein